MVVMYTLRRCGTRRLEGPLNKWHYVTFASKRRAFEVARREAIKRGFGSTSGRVVQRVTDGDDDLARLGAEYLPHAEHTIDVYHVIEKLWNAAGALFSEGSDEAKTWVDEQKKPVRRRRRRRPRGARPTARRRREDRARHQIEARPPRGFTKLHRQACRPHPLRQPASSRPRHRERRRRGGHQVRAREALRPRRDALDQGARPGRRSAPMHRRQRRLGSLRALCPRATTPRRRPRRCTIAYPAASGPRATSRCSRTDMSRSAPKSSLAPLGLGRVALRGW